MNDTETLASADIVIVGAGIAGLCTAWELRERGFGVVLVDQRFPSYGASGRNPGVVWLQTRRTGVELDLARAGRDKYEHYVDVLGDVFDYRRDGGLFFFETEEQGRVVEDYVQSRAAAGLEMELLTREQAAARTPILPDTAIGAAFCADDAQIDSLGFVSAMEAACIRSGVHIFRNTAVLSSVRDGDRVTGVRTVRGTVRASGVVWATGAWATSLRAEGLDLPVQTARVGQLMMQPVESTPSPVLHGPRGVHGCGALTDLASYDASFFSPPSGGRSGEEWASAGVDEVGSRMDYSDVVVLNRGGSLYLGHSIDGRGSLNPHISLGSTRAMVLIGLERYSRYADLGVTGLWAGLDSETPDGLPVVGRADGAYVNVGHSWGVASGPACGQALAEVIAGERSAFADALRADRHALQVASR